MMKKSNKKAIFAVVISFVCIACFLTFLVVTVFKTEKKIFLKDSQGDVFATVEWDGVTEKITAEDDYVKTYASTAFNEAVAIIAEKDKVKDEDKKEYIFDKVTVIETNLDQKILLKLKDTAKNKKFEAASCEMAVTDLNGKLVAVFVAGDTENPYEISYNYVGSTIKPLSVYAPAVESGKYNWSSMLKDSPVSKVKESSGEVVDWPSNSDGEYTYENEALIDALADSTNTVAVKLLKEIGVKKIMTSLEDKYGFDLNYEKMKAANTDETEILGNIALGYLYNGASVIDMAGSFQVFANGGLYTEPTAVDKIVSASDVLYKAEYQSNRVLSKETAEILNEMLQRVVMGGTGKEAYVNGMKIGGKTGTTSGNADNWFVGFTPEYSCAVWHSYLSEGNIAPDIFSDVFKGTEVAVSDYPVSGNVVSKLYCNASGKLSSANCEDSSIGYYLYSDVPDVCKDCE